MSGNNKATFILVGIFVALVALIGGLALNVSAQSIQTGSNQTSFSYNNRAAGGASNALPGSSAAESQTNAPELQAAPSNAQPNRPAGPPPAGLNQRANQPSRGPQPGANNRPPAPPAAPLSGTISAINPDNAVFTFKDANNVEWSASVTTRTQVIRDGQPTTLSDLKVTEQVRVAGRPNQENHTVEAARVVVGTASEPVRPPRPERPLQGQVKSVAASQFVVTVRGDRANPTPTDLTVLVTAETHFNGYKGLNDLQAGKTVFVVGEKQADNTIKATLVSNVAPPPPPPPAPNGSEDESDES